MAGFAPGAALAKRTLDLVFALCALPVVLPLLALCAAAIKLDSPRDPVLFKQPRTGKDGRRFPMYKFRTMVVDADKLKSDLDEHNMLSWPDFKVKRDPRITRPGRFLRKTSLDELPQLFNVLRGEMSLVGPRPTSFDVSSYALWHSERLDVLPGVTGLWQVKGRGRIDFDDRVRLDIAYIENRSLLMDVVLLFRTVPALLRGT